MTPTGTARSPPCCWRRLLNPARAARRSLGSVEEKVFERTGRSSGPRPFSVATSLPSPALSFFLAGRIRIRLSTGAVSERTGGGDPGKTVCEQPGHGVYPGAGETGTAHVPHGNAVRDFRAYARDTDYEQTGGVYVMRVKTADGGGSTTAWELDRNASPEEPASRRRRIIRGGHLPGGGPRVL